MNLIKLVTIFSLVAFTQSVSVAGESSKFEKGECKSVANSSSPYSDLTIECDPSKTVELLIVTTQKEELSDETYRANGNVENLNDYAVETKSLMASFHSSKDKVVGLCVQNYTKKLKPGESEQFTLNCKNFMLPTIKTSDIAYVKVKASPF